VEYLRALEKGFTELKRKTVLQPLPRTVADVGGRASCKQTPANAPPNTTYPSLEGDAAGKTLRLGCGLRGLLCPRLGPPHRSSANLASWARESSQACAGPCLIVSKPPSRDERHRSDFPGRVAGGETRHLPRPRPWRRRENRCKNAPLPSAIGSSARPLGLQKSATGLATLNSSKVFRCRSFPAPEKLSAYAGEPSTTATVLLVFPEGEVKK